MAYPPHRTLASVPVPQPIALKYLTAFLAATKTTPYLIPNARLEPAGPSASMSSAPVQLANLQRFEAGLRGEYLAPVLEFGQDGGMNGGKRGLAALAGEGDQMEAEGWQDLDEYQREQSIEEGELGPRSAAVAQEGDEDFEERIEAEAEGEGEVEEAPKAKKTKTKHEGKSKKPRDKNARKAEKKGRRKEEQRKKHAEHLMSIHAGE